MKEELMKRLDALVVAAKNAWKSWTIAFNAAIGVLALSLMDNSVRVMAVGYIGEDWFTKLLGLVTVINIALRFKTNSPLSQR